MLKGKDFEYHVTWSTGESAILNYNEYLQLKETCKKANITILIDRDNTNKIAKVTVK